MMFVAYPCPWPPVGIKSYGRPQWEAWRRTMQRGEGGDLHTHIRVEPIPPVSKNKMRDTGKHYRAERSAQKLMGYSEDSLAPPRMHKDPWRTFSRKRSKKS